jgi:hypothetical protein
MCLLLIPQQARTEIAQDDNQALKDRAQPAIQHGIAFLRKAQKNGSFSAGFVPDASASVLTVGATALAGIALLECDVAPTDSAVVSAANFVRQNVSAINYNYSVSLAIMFLERLKRTTGKTNDDNLIKGLAKMVVNGQSRDGGWTYTLTATGSDNSNTQFAVVALWMARKHNVTGLEDALARAAKHFRDTQQQKDGGWLYDNDPGKRINDPPSWGSMTCAGCLGIALHAGIMQQASFRSADNSGGEAGDLVVKLNDDPQIARARRFLAAYLASNKGSDPNQGFSEANSDRAYYYLWSMERLCKILHWKKKEFDGVDWYAIGQDYLLRRQNKTTGSWGENHNWGPAVCTSFSLLFLAQSNLLGELYEVKFEGGKALTDTAKTTPLPQTKAEAKMPKAVVLAKDLAKKLIAARPEERPDILSEFELANGTDFSYELAKAIPELATKIAKDSAREVLAKRMARQSVKIIGEYIKEEDPELRLAATRGAGIKSDKEAVPLLIPLLEDRDVNVQDAAVASLRAITGQNHGKSIARWSRWYEMNKK